MRVALFAFNFNQIRKNWNFNRWFLILDGKFWIVDSRGTQRLSEARGPAAMALSSRLYRPALSRSGARIRQEQPELIAVAEHGRFGNSIRQVIQALAVAEKMGIKEVVATSLPQFPRGSWPIIPCLFLTHDPLLRPRIVKKTSTILGGDFFVGGRLPTLDGTNDYHKLAAGLGAAGGLADIPPIDPATVVIHVRSGDAFSDTPHPNMGQPPLSFYTKALRALTPTQVVLVVEDFRNPVIGELVDFLERQSIACVVQSGTFDDDLRVLLAAQTLIVSRGTLADAIDLLSNNLKTRISFGPLHPPRFPKGSTYRELSIQDDHGSYTADVISHWKNSPTQVEMMLTYPTENLVLSWGNPS